MPLPAQSPSPAAPPFDPNAKLVGPAPAWSPPAGDFEAARNSPAAPSFDPNAKLVGPAPAWSPPAGDFAAAGDKPADLSAYGSPAPAWSPPASDKPVDLSAYGTAALPVSTNPIDAARNSAGAVVSGLGKFGNVIDSAIVKTLPPFAAKALGASGDLASGIDQAVINAGTAISGPNQYQPSPVHQLGADVMAGRPLSALNDAAGVVAGAVPYAATALIPGAGPVLLGASGAGNTIAAREQAKGTTTPSFGDVAAGAASGALNAVGGGVAHGLASDVIAPAAERVLGKSLAATTASRIALSGAAGGVSGAGNNIADNAGTGQLSPAGVGNAAVEGAGTGAVSGAAGAVPGAVKTGLGLAGDSITAHSQGPITDAQAASISRIVPDLARFADPANNIRPDAPMPQKVAAYSKTLASQTLGMGDEIAGIPGVPDGTLTRVIRPLISAAAAHNNAIPIDLLHQFNALPIDDATKTTFNNAVADLDTLSQGKLLSNQSGPFASIGSKVAGGATTLALLTHNPGEALANTVMGLGAENKIGGAVGGVIDKVLGTNKPVMLAQSRMALRQAQASGQPIGPSSLDATAAAIPALQTANAAANTATTAQGTQALMRPSAAALATFGPDHPVGQAALAQLQAHGVHEMAGQAIAQFNANQPVVQAKADVKNQAAADAQNEADAQRRRRADAAAALTPLASAQGKIDTAAVNNQTTLDAADLMPHTATPTGLEAVNAAVNQVGRQANAVRALGGQVHPYSPVPGVPTAPQSGPSGIGVSMAPAGIAAPGGGPRTYTEHLIGRAGDEHGVELSPADVQAALTQATAAGQLTPFDYQRVMGNLNNRLASGEDYHTANIILHHAVNAKAAAGVPVRGVKGGVGGGADAPPIYSPTRYANTVATNQGHLSDVAAQADATGDTELADLARALRVTKSITQRQGLRDSVVSARLGRGDILGAGRVKTLLPDALINAGDNTTGG